VALETLRGRTCLEEVVTGGMWLGLCLAWALL
jgi:hypothetical protein